MELNLIDKEAILQGIENALYSVKIAETEQEVDAALRLRYNVFIGELDRDFNAKDGRDYDVFDDQCHHMIVVEKSTDKVIGTYRLQTLELAKKGKGFYTYKRFKLDQLPRRVHENGVEIGRACVHEDHRNGRVLFLLWKGLAGYLEYFQKRYLFGYTALSTTNPQIALNTYSYLDENNFLNPNLHIEVKEAYKCSVDSEQKETTDEIDMPDLLKNYLNVGTSVCSLPAHDKDLQLIHIFTLMDVEQISDRVRKLFFG